MIRVLYITAANLSLRRGHVRNIVKTAEALGNTGEVEVKIISSRDKERGGFLALAVFRERKNFDVLYFRDPKLIVPVWAARMLGKKIVFEVHGSEEWRFLAWLWRLAFRMSDGAVFITRKLAKWYRAGEKPHVVAHVNASDLPLYERSSEEISEFKKTHMLPEDKKILLYLGSTLWYSVPSLLGMVKLLPEGNALVIAGLKEDERSKIALTAKKLGVEERVLLFGRIPADEVPLWHLSADILLNPIAIWYAGSVSSKIYEYLAAGRPIISSPGGANDEVLRDGENALVVGEPFAENFAAAAQKILEDTELARRLSKSAREDAQKYTWEVRARSIAGLLKRL